MALADPAQITINSVANNLTRVKTDGYSSEFRLTSATDEKILNVRNTSYVTNGVKVYRHNIDLQQTVFPVAPSVTPIRRHCYVVIENQQGDTLVDNVNLASGLLNWILYQGTVITKVVNFES